MSDERNALERRQIPVDAMPPQPAYPRTDYQEGDFYLNSEEEGRSKIDWARWGEAILRRKLLIAAVTVAITAVVVIEAYRNKETFRAFTVITVGKEDTSLIKSGDLIVQNDESMKTKLYMLQSSPLIEDVIISLNLEKKEMLDPPKKTLREAFKEMGDTINRWLYGIEPKVALDIPDTVYSGGIQQVSEQQRSPAESWRLEPFIVLFKKNLTVESIPDTRLLRVSFSHPDPVLAATVCNQLAQTFINRNYEGKADKFKKATNWLDNSTRELKARAERAEQALANYTRAHNNIVPQGKGSLSGDKLIRLQGELTRAETERIIKESLYEEVKHGRVAHIPEGFTDVRTIELQRKLGELTVQAAQLEVNYGPDNPQTIEVQQQIAALQKQIDSSRKSLEEKLRVDYERSVRDERAFKEALEQAKNESAKENLDTVQYGILQQEVDNTKLLYRNFVEKSAAANFELAQQQNNLYVVEPARVPGIATGPSRKQWILAGFIFSLILGTGLAILLEFLDHTIKNVDDISRQLQLPTLGMIPLIGEKAPRSLREKLKGAGKLFTASIPSRSLSNGTIDGSENGRALSSANVAGAVLNEPQVIALDNHSPAAEAYRLLRTSIMLSVDVNRFKANTWLVTSSQPGEGKTTTTVNMAISLAQLGKSVLIVDCDLRTPQIHERLHVNQKPGLSTYLSGSAKSYDIIQTLNFPGLSLIPSGLVPDNPTELIGSQKMKEMLDMLAQHFDYILIDSPPMINLADPIILSSLADGVIFIVNGSKSNWESVRRARQELLTAGANILGIVLNEVPLQHTPNSAYYK